jgi:tetratricopeptide (TPR) repeat protein
LGWVYYQRKAYKQALVILEQALAAVPDEGVILEHIADVYDKLGERKKALEFFRKAARGNNLEEKDKKRVDEKLKALGAAES